VCVCIVRRVCVCSCGQYLRRISPNSPYSSPPNPCEYKSCCCCVYFLNMVYCTRVVVR
jgi:hypothetical protein